MEGWIKIHRSIEEWEWASNPLMYYFWVRLLVKVNYEDKEWQGEIVKRGSMVTSLSKLAAEFHLSVKQVRVFLDRLKKGKQVDIITARKWTKIIICKYDDYQVLGHNEGQKDGTQRARRRATTKEDKNINNISGQNAPARENSAPESWRFISSVRRFSLNNNPDLIADFKRDLFRGEVEALAVEVGMTARDREKFISWWTEHDPGKEMIRAEFEAVFNVRDRMRIWMDRNQPKAAQAGPKSRMDQMEDNMKFINAYFDGKQPSATAPDEQ